MNSKKRRHGPKFTLEKPKKYKNLFIKKTLDVKTVYLANPSDNTEHDTSSGAHAQGGRHHVQYHQGQA